MTSPALLSVLAALPLLGLLAACSSTGPGVSGSTTSSGTGGQGSTSNGAGGQGCGGQPLYLVAGDVCIDGILPGCVGDSVQSYGCTSDADCAAAPQNGVMPVCRRCDAQHGFCDAPCTPGAACPGGTCDATSHCARKSCTAAADCPTNFTCGADSLCARKTCAADAECSGFCVSGHCAEAAASCIDCT